MNSSSARRSSSAIR